MIDWTIQLCNDQRAALCYAMLGQHAALALALDIHETNCGIFIGTQATVRRVYLMLYALHCALPM